jgi:hypothetical protein
MHVWSLSVNDYARAGSVGGRRIAREWRGFGGVFR